MSSWWQRAPGLRGRHKREPLPRYFLPITSITFMLWLGSSILVPVLPLFASSLDLSHTDVGLVIGAFFGGRLALNAAGGYLADRYSPRSVAILGCGISGLASCVAGLATSLNWLLIARFAQGGGAGIYLTVAVTAIISISPPDRIGKYISTYQGLGLVGFSIGPVVGGFVAEFAGLRAPFFVYALVVLVGMLVATLKLPGAVLRPERDDAAARVGLAEFARAAFVRPFLYAMAVAIVVFAVRSGIRNNLVPIFAESALGMSEATIGAMLSIATVFNVAILGHAGRSLDRGRRPVMLGGMVLTGGATMVVGLLTEPWMLFLSCAALASATGYASVAPTVVTADVLSGPLQGKAVGVLRMATDLGLLVGPVAVGAIADLAGVRATFAISGVGVLMLALLMIRLPETKPAIGLQEFAA